jgi:4-hydroxybenzoate polyprenyltransferase
VDLASSDVPADRSRRAVLVDLIVHLRPHYQLLLAPIFMWGYFLADRQPDIDFWLAFMAFHVFLYGGATAFNSYYDRDEGPVGGLSQPPPVHRLLLPFSLAVQIAGAALALLVNWRFALVYLAMFSMGIAYSHPAIRLKSRPVVGLLTVGLGQGVLAALGGWFAAQSQLTQLDVPGVLGILAVTLITVGFYPLTQIYQIEEDTARGDTTFAAWAGPRNVFAFAVVVQGVAAALLVAVILALLGPVDAVVVAAFYGVLLAAIVRWWRRFDGRQVLSNYRRVMVVNAVTSVGFLGFIAWHLFVA